MCKKITIIVVAHPDRGAGIDPKSFGVSLAPPRHNIISLGNMGVMICLGQGGLHFPSASSLGKHFNTFQLLTFQKKQMGLCKLCIIK